MEKLLDSTSDFWLLSKYYPSILEELCSSIQFKKTESMIIIDENNSKILSYLFIRTAELSKMIDLLNSNYLSISKQQFLFNNKSSRDSFKKLIESLNNNNRELSDLLNQAKVNIENADVLLLQKYIIDANQNFNKVIKRFKESCQDESMYLTLLKEIVDYVISLKCIEKKCNSFKSEAKSFFN